MAVTGSTAANDYQQLGQRALLFLKENGGVVTEEALIGHVFGGSGNVTLWRSLLRRMLQPEPKLALRADGCWTIVGQQQDDNLPKDFVVIDLETTGLRPRRHRAIEVAIIRYRDGNLLDSYASLINPERPLPDYIAKLTGIVDAQLAGAPLFARVADEIRAFIGDDLIVGYNVGFDVGFLNAEMQRSSRPILINETLDLLPLAMRMLTPARRSGLDSICRTLGIETRERHRAFPDAEVTTMVFGKLLEIAREQGIQSLAGLQRAAGESVPTPRRRGDVGRGRAVLDRRHLEGIPHRPGVYLMHDVHDRVIYVGKAKDLHARVSSYYSQPLGYTRKMDGLLESIERIETIQTGSELEALLLEAQLIRRYDPQFNTQLRHTESYPYIRIDPASSWPRFGLTRQRLADDAIYFGPFRIAKGAREAVDLVNEVFHLRTCTRSFRTARSFGSPCLQLSLGRCPGPCVGSADADDYRVAVHAAIAFLRGEQEEAYDRLHEQLVASAERLDFEAAAKLRDRIKRVRNLVLSQQLLDHAVETGNLLIVTGSPESGARELMLILGGRRWAQIHWTVTDTPEAVAQRLARAYDRYQRLGVRHVEQDMLDEVQIINRWVRKYSPHPAILPIAPNQMLGSVDWASLLCRIQQLDDADLNFTDGTVLASTGEATEVTSSSSKAYVFGETS